MGVTNIPYTRILPYMALAIARVRSGSVVKVEGVKTEKGVKGEDEGYVLKGVKDEKFDGLLITGAPIAEQASIWDCQKFAQANGHVRLIIY